MKFNVDRHWYTSSPQWLTFLLLPFSWIFYGIVAARRFLYRVGFKKQYCFSVPVIIVGNIASGGTGKTPFVIWLAHFLKARGLQPGIVSRGAGGKKHSLPCWVEHAASPYDVGDEAILLRRRTQCPVVVCVDRVAAVKALLEKTSCNIVISDDGLQHYRLGRYLEIVVIDAARDFGNQKLLPAGPLREPISRLQSVDFVVSNGNIAAGGFEMCPSDFVVSLHDAQRKKLLTDLRGVRVHAVAGIGNPGRFFAALRGQGLELIEHIFPDHYPYREKDVNFGDALPVIMTEKDAVKCALFAGENYWYWPVEIIVDKTLQQKLEGKIHG